MNKGIIHKINKVAELENPARAARQNALGKQPTAADLVLPVTGYSFSDEFVCVLGVLGGGRDFA
jgi:hypothetical protein